MRMQNWKKNVTLFGLTTVFIPILVTCLLLLLVLPAYKSELLDTKVNAAEYTESYSEEQINNLIKEFLYSTEMTEYIGEAEVERLTDVLLVELQKAGVEPADAVKADFMTEIEEIAKQKDVNITNELEIVRKELLEKIAQESAANQEKMHAYVDSHKQSDVQGQTSDTKEELLGLTNVVNTTRTELQTLQSQLDSLQSTMKNCVVRYNVEDGHFYCVYNEGTEQEVAKKLDFAQ